MSKLTRETVLENFELVDARIEELETKKYDAFITAGKYLPSVGYIADIETPKELVKANKIVNDETAGFDQSANELKIDLDDEDIETPTILGYPATDWKADIKNRLEQLTDKAELAKLKKAKKVLKGHLSEDDKFSLDMGSISDILKKIPSNEVF